MAASNWPSLYNHIKGLDDLRHELMLYGWRNMEERMLEAASGVSGYLHGHHY